MSTLILQIPVSPAYHEENLRRWEEISCDPEWAKYTGKVETDRHGNIIMMPPASGSHSRLQGEIVFQLRTLLGGKALPECPISTADGVRAADVGWFSLERFSDVEGQIAFLTAPEICVEIRSPSNTDAEMNEKKQLYFNEGAEEVWFCDETGELTFFVKSDPDHPVKASRRCPDFPGPVA